MRDRRDQAEQDNFSRTLYFMSASTLIVRLSAWVSPGMSEIFLKQNTMSSPHLSLQKCHFLLQLFDHAVSLLDHHARVLELNTSKHKVKRWMSPAQRRCDCALEFHRRVSHLFNHLPDFSLLAFQHVIQMVDLLFEYSHLLLQLLSPKIVHRQL